MSFSIDLTNMISIASSLFTALGPIVAVVGGIALGIALVGFILARVTNLKIN